MNGHRRMIVTVGTSLFTSATWNTQGSPLETKTYILRAYEIWLRDHLEDPQGRVWMVSDAPERLSGQSVRYELETQLNRTNAAQWGTWIARDLDHPLRYSAELATIVRLFGTERLAGENFGRFLGNRYREIVLVTIDDRSDLGHIAACHLVEYLKALAEDPGLPIRLEATLRGPRLFDRVTSLDRYLNEQDKVPACDLVVSGGYKVLSTIAGRYAARRGWQLIYVHEDGKDLVQVASHQLRIDSTVITMGPVIGADI